MSTRLYEIVNGIISDRFKSIGLRMDVDEFLNLPICEQRKYLERNTGVKLIVVGSSPSLLSREQIDLDYALRGI